MTLDTELQADTHRPLEGMCTFLVTVAQHLTKINQPKGERVYLGLKIKVGFSPSQQRRCGLRHMGPSSRDSGTRTFHLQEVGSPVLNFKTKHKNKHPFSSQALPPKVPTHLPKQPSPAGAQVSKHMILWETFCNQPQERDIKRRSHSDQGLQRVLHQVIERPGSRLFLQSGNQSNTSDVKKQTRTISE